MSEENLFSDLEVRITEAMARCPKGVSNKTLLEAIPSMSTAQLVEILNKLISQDKIQILSKGKQLVYMLKDQKATKKCSSTDVEENLVFQAVERAGNNGVSSKDLKFSCNLPQAQITKILKGLEGKKLIKCVVSTSKKKVFMLFDLEPSHSITGGTFYSGQEFESEFVDVLSEQCYRYLLQNKTVAEKLTDPISQRNASFKSSKDICTYINGLKISKVQLSVQDIETVLEALIYDAKLEKSITMNTPAKGSENLYRVTKPLVSSVGLMRMPCGVCHVFKDCHKGGIISPSTCVYMKEWLEF
ncbi:DNA-directed RNA polymerase III subunit RPC6-like [Uloborus diversus]|uniref:DNA-directed RNA polymerase III subunit RPC6-like n=1 Tax=Uloborus diversus TaxID=327109 RepID=UPI002409E264|nr:DNA-directed RNA polymerase III subunit RPC6-like [Uloborus diversus]